MPQDPLDNLGRPADGPAPAGPDHRAQRSRRTEFLLAEARGGSDAAWRELFERYKRMLLVTIECRLQGTLRRRFDAEDVLQQAFWKAWAKIESFDYAGEGSFRRWLKRIVFSEFYNLIKAQERERRSAQDGDPEARLSALRSPDGHPSQIVSEIEARADVLRRMNELDEEQQELLSMRIFERLDWRQIGAVLGCNRVTAKQRFDRAIANLARELDA